MSDPVRSRQARQLAERALVRLVAAYGEIPEFVLLGGLVPDLLCSQAADRHVGTTDVDVQVDLEIQGGSVKAVRLERALREADFIPDRERVWRWRDQVAPAMVVKIEFLADLDDVPNQKTISFDDCQSFGAINLRGTGFASQDWDVRTVTADLGHGAKSVELRVATLPAYLLAKVHAARSRGGRRLHRCPGDRRVTSPRPARKRQQRPGRVAESTLAVEHTWNKQWVIAVNEGERRTRKSGP